MSRRMPKDIYDKAIQVTAALTLRPLRPHRIHWAIATALLEERLRWKPENVVVLPNRKRREDELR